MNAKYKGGHLIPSNVEEALIYMGKVGVMTRETWFELFAQGCNRWKRRQLLNLIRKGLAKIHTCGSVDALVLTELGKERVKKLSYCCVLPIPPHYIEHDETVAKAVVKLQRSGIFHKWLTERELKSQNFKEYLLENVDGKVKYPDAILKILNRGEINTVAIEYERTGKTTSRYRSILWQYNGLEDISLVIYVVEDLATKRRIKSALSYLGNVSLVDKIAFMDAQDWKNDPLKSNLEMPNEMSNLENIFMKMVA